MDLSCFVYDFNLVTTNTAKDVYESCSIINKGRKEKIVSHFAVFCLGFCFIRY